MADSSESDSSASPFLLALLLLLGFLSSLSLLFSFFSFLRSFLNECLGSTQFACFCVFYLNLLTIE